MEIANVFELIIQGLWRQDSDILLISLTGRVAMKVDWTTTKKSVQLQEPLWSISATVLAVVPSGYHRVFSRPLDVLLICFWLHICMDERWWIWAFIMHASLLAASTVYRIAAGRVIGPACGVNELSQEGDSRDGGGGGGEKHYMRLWQGGSAAGGKVDSQVAALRCRHERRWPQTMWVLVLLTAGSHDPHYDFLERKKSLLEMYVALHQHQTSIRMHVSAVNVFVVSIYTTRTLIVTKGLQYANVAHPCLKCALMVIDSQVSVWHGICTVCL